jgi:Flp pilus assembly pilin Flp
MIRHRYPVSSLRRLLRSENGQDAIEYALITGIFSLTVIALFPPLMDLVERRFDGVIQILASVLR